MKTIKAKTVITPTEDRTNILLDVKNNNIFFTTSEKMKPLEYQHLHITTDDEIKTGDWVIQTNFEKSHSSIIKIENEMQCKFANDKNGSFTKRRIIATNDPKLLSIWERYEEDGWSRKRFIKRFPQIPESFIKRYCEAGDIDEVNIKMEDYCPKIACNNDLCHDGCKEKKSRIKINPDNTINIHSSNEYVTPQD